MNHLFAGELPSCVFFPFLGMHRISSRNCCFLKNLDQSGTMSFQLLFDLCVCVFIVNSLKGTPKGKTTMKQFSKRFARGVSVKLGKGQPHPQIFALSLSMIQSRVSKKTLSVSLPTHWERSKVGHWISTRLSRWSSCAERGQPHSGLPGHWLSVAKSCFCPSRTRKHTSHLEYLERVSHLSPYCFHSQREIYSFLYIL